MNPLENAQHPAVARLYSGWRQLVDEASQRLPGNVYEEAVGRIQRAAQVHAVYLKSHSRKDLSDVVYLLTPANGAPEPLAQYLNFALQLLAESLMELPPPQVRQKPIPSGPVTPLHQSRERAPKEAPKDDKVEKK